MDKIRLVELSRPFREVGTFSDGEYRYYIHSIGKYLIVDRIPEYWSAFSTQYLTPELDWKAPFTRRAENNDFEIAVFADVDAAKEALAWSALNQ